MTRLQCGVPEKGVYVLRGQPARCVFVFGGLRRDGEVEYRDGLDRIGHVSLETFDLLYERAALTLTPEVQR